MPGPAAVAADDALLDRIAAGDVPRTVADRAGSLLVDIVAAVDDVPISLSASSLSMPSKPAAPVRRPRWALRAGVAAAVTAAVLGGGIAAAAADVLPRPLQRVVSTVVDHLTPFTVPNPDEHGHLQQPGNTSSPDDPPRGVGGPGAVAPTGAPDSTRPERTRDDCSGTCGAGIAPGSNRSGEDGPNESDTDERGPVPSSADRPEADTSDSDEPDGSDTGERGPVPSTADRPEADTSDSDGPEGSDTGERGPVPSSADRSGADESDRESAESDVSAN